MVGRFSRVLVVVFLLVGVLAVAQRSHRAVAAPAGRHSHRVLAFAQDGDAYAWVTAPCTAHFRPSASRPAVVTVEPYHYCAFLPKYAGKPVLFRTSLVWLERPPAIEYDSDVMAWAPRQPVREIYDTSQNSQSLNGSYVAAVSAGGGTGAFALVDVEATNCGLNSCDDHVAGGHLRLLDARLRELPLPRLRELPVAVAAARMSVWGQRIALVPAPDDATIALHSGPSNTSASVEVRSARTGKLLWHVDTSAPVAELAASSAVVAALLATDAASSSIVVCDVATGTLLRTVAVPASASDLSASATHVVYRTGKLIWLLGRSNPLAVASSSPVGLSVSGNRVGWADARGVRFARVP